MKNILLICADHEIINALSDLLAPIEEFKLSCCFDGFEAVKILSNTKYDLLLIDSNLSDTSQHELLLLLQKNRINYPIVLLTNKKEDHDKLSLFAISANSFLTKPFKFLDLLELIKAKLLQQAVSVKPTPKIGPYKFKPERKVLISKYRKEIRLTEKEANILKFLLAAENEVVSREVLLHEIWGYNAGVTTHTLETHIYRLRQKIELDPSRAELLVTEIGGYRLYC